jgi:type IV fimbrial biogenesis protein FimT
MAKRTTSRGFTLIELMITLAILAIVITVGIPSLSDFVAAQRVRTIASDIMADMAYARAEAIKESRVAIMAPINAADWKDGWRICVDLDGGGDCDVPGEVRKTATPISGRTKVCATPNEPIVFRPDGRVTRVTAPSATDGIRVSDDLGDAVATNDKVRLVYLGISGRPSVEAQDGGTVCP